MERTIFFPSEQFNVKYKSNETNSTKRKNNRKLKARETRSVVKLQIRPIHNLLCYRNVHVYGKEK